MNAFDITIVEFFNQIVNVSWAFDGAVRFVSGNKLVKAGALLALLWWAWFKAEKKQQTVKVHVTATLFGCIVAMAISRLLSTTLPFRARPLHEPRLALVPPDGMSMTILEGWSSFPSDHAVLFYAMSVGMLFISRRLGVFAIVYTTVFIAMPRVYLGLHYPTDIIAGALIGIVIALIANKSRLILHSAEAVVAWSVAKPQIFFPVFFLVTYQIADLFANSIAFVDGLNRFVHMAN